MTIGREKQAQHIGDRLAAADDAKVLHHRARAGDLEQLVCRLADDVFLADQGAALDQGGIHHQVARLLVLDVEQDVRKPVEYLLHQRQIKYQVDPVQ
ncbi:hypothetical protein D3C72_2292630 [compost metagenome]